MNPKLGAWAQIISGLATVAGVTVSPENATAICSLGVTIASLFPSVLSLFRRGT